MNDITVTIFIISIFIIIGALYILARYKHFNILKTGLLIFIALGYTFAFLTPVLNKGLHFSERSTFESFYSILNLRLPVATALLLAIWLFSMKSYKNSQLTGSTFKKIFNVFFRLILVIVTAIISWMVLVFIGFGAGVYSMMSTYGTPIHRPRIR